MARDGTTKVTDFGTATAGLASLAGPVSGATYDSPEQLQGRTADGRSDLYALGVILYEAITGAPPFLGTDAVAITQRKLNERVIPPSVAMPGIPPGFDAIVDRLLERDPALRYGSGAEVARDLTRLGETAQIPVADATQALPVVAAAAVPAAAVAATPPPEEKKSRATGWIIAAIVILVLAIGAVAAYAITQNDDSKKELVPVPAVVGQPVATAVANLKAAGLSPTTQKETSDLFGEGIVFEQAPVAATQARKGSVVVLKVSAGPTTTTTSSTTSTSTSTSTSTTSTSTTTTTTTTVPPPPST
jgi:serine/threonine-protein kinase